MTLPKNLDIHVLPPPQLPTCMSRDYLATLNRKTIRSPAVVRRRCIPAKAPTNSVHRHSQWAKTRHVSKGSCSLWGQFLDHMHVSFLVSNLQPRSTCPPSVGQCGRAVVEGFGREIIQRVRNRRCGDSFPRALCGDEVSNSVADTLWCSRLGVSEL